MRWSDCFIDLLKRDRQEHNVRILLTGLFLLTVLVILPRRPINHVDFTTYVVTTLAWLAGKQLYTLTLSTSAETWSALTTEIHSPYLKPMPFFYSPVSLGLFLPFALLAQQAGVRVSALVWDGFKLLLLWWTLRWATRWVSLSADRLHIATLLWLPIISDFSLGQVNITFLAIFSAALATSEQWRGFLLGIGFHLKGLLLAPLAVLLGRGRKSAFLWGLAGLAIPMLLFALLDLSLLYFYFAQRFLPLILSPVKPVTDPDLLLLIGTSHLHFPPLLRATSLVIGGLVALLVRREREALVVMAGTAALFSGVAERGHLLLLLPALWLLLEAAQEGRLSAFAYGLGLAGFLIFTIGNLSSLATIDLPRLLGLTTRISPVAFASPILGSLFTLEWFCATFDPGDSAT